MKALVKKHRAPGLWMEDVPAPTPGDGDVLIKVERAAICGTDLHIYNWDAWAEKTVPVPLVVGHEYTGVVAEVGANVRAIKVGDRVSGEGHLVCGTCRNCRAGREHLCRDTRGVGVHRPGAFAEYLVLPAHNIAKLPDDLDPDIAAILDPLGNAVHTALSFDLVGEDVLITGAGPIGLMSAAVARHVGARNIVITDINPGRLAHAAEFGVTRAVNAGTENLRDVMSDLGMTEGFDVGLEMAGAPAALRDMVGAMNNGGKIGLLGLPAAPFPIDWSELIFKGLTVKGIYGREMFETWYKMIAMLEGGLDVAPVITHRLPFAQFEDGFTALNDGQASKVVLQIA
ncbi:MAG: L-threonine 3-dehydrogenase [Pseudomonadota bacterium]